MEFTEAELEWIHIGILNYEFVDVIENKYVKYVTEGVE